MNTQTPTGQSRQIPEEVRLLVNRIFSVFKLTYPTWNSNLADSEINYKRRQWAFAIIDTMVRQAQETTEEFTLRRRERIQRAIDLSIKQYPDHAPNIGRFMKLTERHQAHLPAAPRSRQLPAPSGSSLAKGKAAIDKLLKITKGIDDAT